MSPDLVVLIAAFMCSAAVAGWVWLAERLDQPRPARPQRAPRDPFADPADLDDPHGDQYVTALKAHEQRSPDLAALTCSPSGTGWLEPLPEDDDDKADITGVQPAASWAAHLDVPVGEYVDGLFAQHAEVQP